MEEIKYYENLDHSKMHDDADEAEAEKLQKIHEEKEKERKRKLLENAPLRYKMKIKLIKRKVFNDKEPIIKKTFFEENGLAPSRL